jgi:hypothetical protein
LIYGQSRGGTRTFIHIHLPPWLIAGRFDILTFVGTPNIVSRVRRLSDKLRGMPLSPDKIKVSTLLFEQVLVDNWNSLRFLTFAENEVLINFIAEYVSSSLYYYVHVISLM